VSLWDEARAWFVAQAIDQWQYPARREAIDANIAAKDECWILENEHGIVGTITLDKNADPEFWMPGDSPDEALYIHRMIVRREFAGAEVGSAVIDWASQRAAAAGKRWLRLDAWRTNPRLQRYYAQHGFKLVRTVELPHRRSGALFQRPAGVVLARGPRVIEVGDQP
jgi:GNAT superfamily N-acetyltransferase